jgi:hypothetical protein
LASDGLWEAFLGDSNNETSLSPKEQFVENCNGICDLVLAMDSASSAARKVCELAYNRGSKDNISIIVIFLNHKVLNKNSLGLSTTSLDMKLALKADSKSEVDSKQPSIYNNSAKMSLQTTDNPLRDMKSIPKLDVSKAASPTNSLFTTSNTKEQDVTKSEPICQSPPLFNGGISNGNLTEKAKFDSVQLESERKQEIAGSSPNFVLNPSLTNESSFPDLKIATNEKKMKSTDIINAPRKDSASSAISRSKSMLSKSISAIGALKRGKSLKNDFKEEKKKSPTRDFNEPVTILNN